MFFDNINKIDEPLARLNQEIKEGRDANYQCQDSGNILHNLLLLKGWIILRKSFEQLYANKSYSLYEKDKLLERHTLPKLTQEKKRKIT